MSAAMPEGLARVTYALVAAALLVLAVRG